MTRKRPVRRSQLICPFGVGAIVDFRGPESLMTAGLDAWPKAREPQEQCTDLVILEERLQARLGKSHFRLPPHFDDDAHEIDELIPVVRFPSWHYCPDCCVMRHTNLYESRSKCTSIKCQKRPEKFRSWLMPVRIVTICPLGHIDDFPFHAWVHDTPVANVADHELSWRASGTSSSLSGITISCSCRTSRTLQGAFSFSSSTNSGALREINIDCAGRRPWLGQAGTGCGEALRVVQRGATNVYFPVIRSSIYLPTSCGDHDDWLLKCVDEVVRKSAGKDDEYRRKCIGHVAFMDNVDEKLLAQAVEQRLARENARQGQTLSEEQFRHEEFQALRGADLNPGKDLNMKEFPIADYGDLSKFFSRIRLVCKLRETRVLESFTRITPLDNGQSSPQELCSDRNLGWLPAIIVRGEGIFFEFKEHQFVSWEAAVSRRVVDFRQGYENSVRRQDARATRLTARFVLLHTFAHLMIRELTFECGYGSAALRERIYCDIDGQQMNGVLIYTASGDSEGTLGGLVRQGHPDRLIRCFQSAINKALWCSGDPVCIESAGQGTNNANLAACHGCALLPETCCEQGNVLLDRALLIGRPKDRTIGFFCDI